MTEETSADPAAGAPEGARSAVGDPKVDGGAGGPASAAAAPDSSGPEVAGRPAVGSNGAAAPGGHPEPGAGPKGRAVAPLGAMANEIADSVTQGTAAVAADSAAVNAAIGEGPAGPAGPGRRRRRWLPRQVKWTIVVVVLFFVIVYVVLPEIASARRSLNLLNDVNGSAWSSPCCSRWSHWVRTPSSPTPSCRPGRPRGSGCCGSTRRAWR